MNYLSKLLNIKQLALITFMNMSMGEFTFLLMQQAVRCSIFFTALLDNLALKRAELLCLNELEHPFT
jgi:hypothetical protein